MYGFKNIAKTILIFCSFLVALLLYHFSKDFSPSKAMAFQHVKSVSNQKAITLKKEISTLEKEARWFPTVDNFYRLSEAHFKQNHYAESFYYAEKAVLLEDRNPIFLYQLGKTYYKLGNHAKAAKKLKKVLRLNPDFLLAKELLEEINPENHSYPRKDLFALNPASQKSLSSYTK